MREGTDYDNGYPDGGREANHLPEGFRKRRYLILSALRAQKNLMYRYVFYKRKRPDGRWFASLPPSGSP